MVNFDSPNGEAMGTRFGTTGDADPARGLINPVMNPSVVRGGEKSQRVDPRPSAHPADSAAPVVVNAHQAAAVAHLLRRSGRPGTGQVVDTLESARVTPQDPQATLLRRTGMSDLVLIPVELTAVVAEAMTAGFEVLHRVDRVRPPADLVALRDRLRRAPLVADLDAEPAARGTPRALEAQHVGMEALTPTEAAHRRGVTPNRIRQLCRAGRIEGARKHGRDWIIPATATINPPQGT